MSALTDYLDRLATPDTNGLLPCERCGEDVLFLDDNRKPGQEWLAWVACSSCGARTGSYSVRSDSVRQWNHRPLLSALRLAIAQRDNAMMAASVLSEGPFDTTFVDAAILAKLEGK